MLVSSARSQRSVRLLGSSIVYTVASYGEEAEVTPAGPTVARTL